MEKEKKIGLIVNLIIYVLAFGIAFIPYYFISQTLNPILSMFIYTIIATFIVLIFAEIYKNTSIYDPYWSVAPLIMGIIYMIRYSLYNINSLIFLIIVFWYSFRLTRNWAITYKGLNPKYEDWRYSKFRSMPWYVFQFINIVGLIYVPTLVVYVSLIPGLLFMENTTFNPLSIIGFIFMILGPVLEIISDYQVHKFLKDNDDHTKVCNYGLWNYSRHPNYLGELTFWFGIMLVYMLTNMEAWYYGLGFVFMLLLFLCISIPLMESHNKEKRPTYKEYQKHTSVLLILPRRK